MEEGIWMAKKDAIVQSAIHLFQKNGIERTKISDIVKKAEIAQGTFYLYIPSKLALIPAIAEENVIILIQRNKQDAKNNQNDEEKFTNLVNSIIKINEEYSEVRAMIYSGIASTEHLKEWETFYDPYYHLLSNLL